MASSRGCQRAWDRVLEAKPVLLVLIGSDLSMMEALNSYGRPFHQRGREMVLGPLNPAEVGQMLGLDPAEAFDAALVTGGLARTVLAAIDSGERTFTNIARAAGGIGATPLQRALELLTDKRIVSAELPVSLRPSNDRRYRVTDPYLRFWLHLLGPSMEEIERGAGRSDLGAYPGELDQLARPRRRAPCPRGPGAATAR